MSGSSQTRSVRSLALSLFAGAMTLASPARTDVIPSGIDVWHTPAGGAMVKVLPDQLGCTHPQIEVPSHGVPVATTPSGVLGQSDTVLFRPNAVTVAPGGSRVSTALRIVALSFESDSTFDACNKTWNLSTSLGGRTQATDSIGIDLDSSGLGGTYETTFRVRAVLKATSGSTTRTIVADEVEISTVEPAKWAPNPGAGGVEGDPDLIDTNGDGIPDTDFPGTFAFAPGWACDLAIDPDCSDPNPDPPNHQGDHPDVDPIPTGC